MSEITRVALDAMGGDNAPREMVKRCRRGSAEEKGYQGTADR